MKMHPTIGCCGIDCGLCPRFYTDGSSRCPGCGGEGFESKHPPCSVKSCCTDRRGLDACGQCAEFHCVKYADREKIERDSFVTHKRMFHNHELIRAHGIDRFIASQNERSAILREMLAQFDDGRSKSFFCLAAALLRIEHLRAAMAEADTKQLKAALRKYSEIEGVELALKK